MRTIYIHHHGGKVHRLCHVIRDHHLRAFKPRSCRSPRVLPLALQHHGLEEQIMYTLHPENDYRVIYSQLKVSNIYTN